MPARDYGEYCGLARALELVGERWGLLVVRELLVGPRRFTDLARGLPRIPSNVLSTRLRELEQAGVVERRLLPRPSGAVVYDLTPYGRELDEIMLRIAAWGTRSLAEPREGAAVSPASMLLGLRANFRPEAARGLHAGYELHLGETVVHARVDDGALTVGEGPLPGADLRIDADLSLRAVMAGGRSDTIGLDGDVALFDRFVEMFRIEQVPGPTVSGPA